MITVKFYDESEKFLGEKVFYSLDEWNSARLKNLREGFFTAKKAKTFSEEINSIDGITNIFF